MPDIRQVVERRRDEGAENSLPDGGGGHCRQHNHTIWELDLHAVIGVVALVAAVSLLTSLAGIPEAPEE